MYRSCINPGILTQDEGFIYQDAEAQAKIVDLLCEKNIRVRSRINCHLDDTTSCRFPTHRSGHIHLRHNHARVEHCAKQRLTVHICIVTELSILNWGGLCLTCPDPSNPLTVLSRKKIPFATKKNTGRFDAYLCFSRWVDLYCYTCLLLPRRPFVRDSSCGERTVSSSSLAFQQKGRSWFIIINCRTFFLSLSHMFYWKDV